MRTKNIKKYVGNYFYKHIKIPMFKVENGNLKFYKYNKNIFDIHTGKIKHRKGDIRHRHLKNPAEFRVWLGYIIKSGQGLDFSNDTTFLKEINNADQENSKNHIHNKSDTTINSDNINNQTSSQSDSSRNKARQVMFGNNNH